MSDDSIIPYLVLMFVAFMAGIMLSSVMRASNPICKQADNYYVSGQEEVLTKNNKPFAKCSLIKEEEK